MESSPAPDPVAAGPTPFGYFRRALVDDYANFSGRATRAEFWWFQLGMQLLFLVALTIPVVLTLLTKNPWWVLPIFPLALATVIPSWAVTVRRLHDIGRSGRWCLVALIPYASVLLFVFALVDSEPGANEWGPSEKYGADPVGRRTSVAIAVGAGPPPPPAGSLGEAPPPPRFATPRESPPQMKRTPPPWPGTT